MAKKQSGGDYDGWILRLIERAEELKFSFSEAEWLEFAASKIVPRQGYDLTTAQLDVLSEKRGVVFEEIPQRLGIKFEQPTRYRAVKTGVFVREKDGYFRDKRGRFVKVIPEKTYRVRDIKKGTMAKLSAYDDEIQGLKKRRDD